MIDLVGSFKTLQNELCKNLFGWPKGLPSFTSSTPKTTKQPVNLQDDLRSTCFDWCLAPKPPQKKLAPTCVHIWSRLRAYWTKTLCTFVYSWSITGTFPFASHWQAELLNVTISLAYCITTLNRRFFHDKRGCSQALRHKFWKLYRLSENI